MGRFLKHRATIVKERRILEKYSHDNKLLLSDHISNSFNYAELGIYGGAIAILSKALQEPILLASPIIQELFKIRDDATLYEVLKTPYKSQGKNGIIKWEVENFDYFIDLLFFLSRMSGTPEYVHKINNHLEDKFEYSFEKDLREKYDILHCSSGEILFFLVAWRLTIELIKRSMAISKDSQAILQNGLFDIDNINESWFHMLEKLSSAEIVEKKIIEYFDIAQKLRDDIAQKLRKKKSEKDSLGYNITISSLEDKLEICDAILNAKNKLYKLADSMQSIENIFEKLGLFNNKIARREFTRYSKFIFGENFPELDKKNCNEFAKQFIYNLLEVLEIEGKEPSLETLLLGIHKVVRFPIVPYYYLVAYDENKGLKEHIVFPIWYAFSSNTVYEYDTVSDGRKQEAGVLHALYTIRPIWEVLNNNSWYINDSKNEAGNEVITEDFEFYLDGLLSSFINMAKPIIDKEYYGKTIIKQLRDEALQSAVAQIFARNFAHNIGAHVAIRSTNTEVKKRILQLYR